MSRCHNGDLIWCGFLLGYNAVDERKTHGRPEHSTYVKENTRTNIYREHNALKINQLKTSLSFFLSLFHLQLLNGRTHLTPTQAAANSHHSNGLPARHVASPRVGGWTGDESTSRTGASAWSQTGAGGGGRGRREEVEEEERGRTHPLEVLSGHPSSLDSTLQHIVQQLDILTQVSY